MSQRDCPSPRAFQEYLEALARSTEQPDSVERTRDLMRSYAEICFQANGGSYCAVCRAHVRHVLPVLCEHTDGEHKEFPCLCTRCFEGERGLSRRMWVRLGKSTIEYPCKGTSGEPATISFQVPHPHGMGF